jgi:hypothetical protein
MPVPLLAVIFRAPRKRFALANGGERNGSRHSLTRRCALTAPFHPYLAPQNAQKRRVPGTPHQEMRDTRRYFLCGTFRRLALTPASRTLSGTLLCGVRTFLQDRLAPLSATVRSDCQHHHYIRCHRRRTGPAKVDRQFWRRRRLRGKPAGCAARNPPMRSAVPARSPSA